MGDKYTNNVFVGDINNGNLYFFQMNEERNGFNLASPGLDDKVVDNSQELDSVVLGLDLVESPILKLDLMDIFMFFPMMMELYTRSALLNSNV